MALCFVILHYLTSEDTVECVESIKKLNGSFPIVIVDNASKNGSIEKIKNLYGDEQNIFIIKNEVNLGFAEGNNVGYRYAKDILHSEMIVLLNNDILIPQKDFANRIEVLYKRSEFYVAGPDIISLVDHKHQSPVNETVLSRAQVNNEIKRYQFLRVINFIGLYDFLKKTRKKSTTNQTINDEHMVYREDVMLHGSFVIFSSKFIEQEENAFRPGTFLYMEEPILYKYCRERGYKIVFEPDIKIFHKEDSSTNSLTKVARTKREFVFKNMVKSLKVYKELLK